METLRRMLAVLTLMMLAAAAWGSRTADLAEEPGVRQGFRELLMRGRRGMSRDEHAAFVVRGADGGFGFVEWPDGDQPDSARWEGAYPPRTVAIAHTHPNWLPEPSRLDAAVARRTRLPVYVITRGRVSKTDGEATEVVTEGSWAEQ
jgi:Prokaryotic homologs of the JAB domain